MLNDAPPGVQASPRAGFSTLDQEVAVDDLPVSGSLPEWLRGSLLRNGPGRFEGRHQQVNHWFDGMAMLHRFTVAGGRVGYANRFLRTKAYRALRDEGRLAYKEFATDPCRSIFKRLATVFDPQMTDNTFINLTRLGERHLAMTESPLSIAFDPDTLETLGYGPEAPPLFATAHPHRDPATGALINHTTHVGPINSYRFYVQPPKGKAKVLSSRRVRRPAYIHSFAMSERWLALTEFPYTVDPRRLVLTETPFIDAFRWRPEDGTRIHVIDRGSGRRRGTFETDAAWGFHHVGAWDHGNELVMEFCDYGSPAVIRSLYLDRLRADVPPADGSGHRAYLRRLRINLESGRVESEQIGSHNIEMPRINEERSYLRPYRHVYGVAASPGNSYDVADRLIKLDTETGDAAVWDEPSCYPGEPIFVGAPGGRAEDEGVALSVVLDAERGRSFLLALDAASWQEVARAEAPHAIPTGIHGAFYRASR